MIQIIFVNKMAFLFFIVIDLNEKRALLTTFTLYLIILITLFNHINILHLINIIDTQILIMQNIQFLNNFFNHFINIFIFLFFDFFYKVYNLNRSKLAFHL